MDQHACKLLAINQSNAMRVGHILATLGKVIACRNDPRNLGIPIVFRIAIIHVFSYLLHGPFIRLTVRPVKLGLNVNDRFDRLKSCNDIRIACSVRFVPWWDIYCARSDFSEKSTT